MGHTWTEAPTWQCRRGRSWDHCVTISCTLILSRMEWMPSTLQLRAIMCSLWSTSFKICIWRTWTRLMRYARYGGTGLTAPPPPHQILLSFCPCWRCQHSQHKRSASSSIILEHHGAGGKCGCWWWPRPCMWGAQAVVRKPPDSFFSVYSLVLAGV